MTEAISRPDEAPAVAEPAAKDPGAKNRKWAGLLGYRAGFIVCFLAAWWLLHRFVLPDVLPSVDGTLAAMVELLTGAEFYEQMALTVRRVIGGFAIAYVVAMVLGTLMGRSKRAEAFFEIFVVAGLSQPGIFIAMIILVALGLRESSAIIAMGFLAMPMVTVNFWQGTKSLDPALDQMAQVFGYSGAQKVRHVILPQLLSPAMAAARHGFGISWKYVVVIELLGLPDGVGYQVNRAFQLFDLQSVIAWTLGFMLFVALFEYLALRPLERRLFAWRDSPTGRLNPADAAATA